MAFCSGACYSSLGGRLAFFPVKVVLAKNQAQCHNGELAVPNYETHTYTTGIKAFNPQPSSASSDRSPCFIFIGVPL